MHLAVTRPLEDAASLATTLEARGHTVIVEPLLGIRFHEKVRVAGDAYRGVLVTSANGVRGLEACGAATSLKAVPVYAVGAATAEAATAAGFEAVVSAEGDLPALSRLVQERVPRDGAPLLYAAGKTVSGDLQGLLEAAGYAVDRVVLYEAVPAVSLTPGLHEALVSGMLDGVLLFSPRTARIWANLIIGAGLAAAAGRVRHYCLSRAVADALGALGGTECRVAATPDTDGLLVLLDMA